ncbi:hypothetical protein [Paenibacillus sp. FSL R5-0519]|uniref:hypothetical protein n=1 Tax=Paenibacillus sp. FSL R5-0519 TaxID=2921648 RepID=UPI0030D79455
MPKVFPWVCDNCGNRWVDGLFVCWDNCPECGGESQHESVRELQDGDEWYTED